MKKKPPPSDALTRYVAMLRGVSPMNCKMPELKAAFEKYGFVDVKTVISSGNVVFSARDASDLEMEQECEAAMSKHLGRVFKTFVRRVDELRELLASDPYAAHSLPAGSKRVVTFLPKPLSKRSQLPIEYRGALILCERERDVLSSYVPGPDGPTFMTLLEKTYGKDITTRTWDTVAKLAR